MRTSASELLLVATPILQGLLASGHYTNGTDGVITTDNGVDWAEKGGGQIFVKRNSARAVADALTLAQELIDLSKLRGK